MPNPTNVGTLFQDGEVGEAGLPEDMSRGDSRHAGADDHDPGISAAGFGGDGSVVRGVDTENPMLAETAAARLLRSFVFVAISIASCGVLLAADPMAA
jgi:hypothetical protein